TQFFNNKTFVGFDRNRFNADVFVIFYTISIS
ncbi:unnamed protein product, partial [marine sediment metagenome]